MDSRYQHDLFEQAIYQQWEDAHAFDPDATPSTTGKSFSIIMPPPNANDPLHVGHAMFISLEDVMVRYHRMLGDDTVWIPGTDHAGIETQFVFEKKLAKKDQSRFDFDRESLYKMIWEYVQENSDTAVNQMKKLGASADWTRFKFMLDEDVVGETLNTFVKMFKDGLVYRQERLVNYCTKCGTAFSELEVNYEERVSPLYYVRYHFFDQPEEYVVVATTRPEPIFADTHLAVHPDNPKTKHLLGRQLKNPLTGAAMDIIADEFVDPEFGTGIVKLTPAHDATDFEVAQKHHLPIVHALNTRGKMTENGGKFAGLNVKKAREAVVAQLTAQNDIEKINEKYTNRVGTCYRCGTVIEPLPLPQFFVKVRPLAERVLAAGKNGEFKVYGAGYDKILTHWLENLRDWNISRQIVWGIRMPVWYSVTENPEIMVSFRKDGTTISGSLREVLQDFEGSHTLADVTTGLQSLTAPTDGKFVVSLDSPGAGYIQETDTFDTWFSSGQWPYTTLKHTKLGDFERFYPTSVMETGYDILPFWVMRMLMLGLYAQNKVPFTEIYLHGLVRDEKGQKMSKSKGNVINPLDVVAQYGADALRLALVIRSTPGLDKSVGPADFKASRNLTNKIWNAARFVSLITEQTETAAGDAAFYDQLNQLITDVTQQLSDLRVGLAADTLYDRFWHWYCDECIEANKNGNLSSSALWQGLVTFLKLLHPFVPFVTEAVWQELRPEHTDMMKEPLLITAAWPVHHAKNS
jgi:valyl-tRNA synthetase